MRSDGVQGGGARLVGQVGGPGGDTRRGVLGAPEGVLRNAGIKGIGNCKKCRSK